MRAYVRGGSRSGMSRGMSLHTIDVGHTRGLTHSDTLDSDIDRRRRRSLTMEMKVGDDVAAGPSRLGHYKHLTAYQGGVTPIDSIVTAATALSERSTVKPSE